jgi:hypothetical protein
MGYITINTDVDVSLDDIEDSDILDIIEDRLDTYKRRKNELAHADLISDIKDILKDSTSLPESNTTHIDEDSLLGELKLKVCKELMNKYSLEQLETFLNK